MSFHFKIFPTIILFMTFSMHSLSAEPELAEYCESKWSTDTAIERCKKKNKKKNKILKFDIYSFCKNSHKNDYDGKALCIFKQMTAFNHIKKTRKNDPAYKFCLEDNRGNLEIISHCIRKYKIKGLYKEAKNNKKLINRLCKAEWEKTPKMIATCVNHHYVKLKK